MIFCRLPPILSFNSFSCSPSDISSEFISAVARRSPLFTLPNVERKVDVDKQHRSNTVIKLCHRISLNNFSLAPHPLSLNVHLWRVRLFINACQWAFFRRPECEFRFATFSHTINLQEPLRLEWTSLFPVPLVGSPHSTFLIFNLVNSCKRDLTASVHGSRPTLVRYFQTHTTHTAESHIDGSFSNEDLLIIVAFIFWSMYFNTSIELPKLFMADVGLH